MISYNICLSLDSWVLICSPDCLWALYGYLIGHSNLKKKFWFHLQYIPSKSAPLIASKALIFPISVKCPHFPPSIPSQKPKVYLNAPFLPTSSPHHHCQVLRSPSVGNGNPLQYSCLENSWTEEPGRLQFMGLQRIRHNWEANTSVSEWMKVAQSYPMLCNPIDYTVHGILQARILEWVAFPFSRKFPNPGIEPRSPAV